MNKIVKNLNLLVLKPNIIDSNKTFIHQIQIFVGVSGPFQQKYFLNKLLHFKFTYRPIDAHYTYLNSNQMQNFTKYMMYYVYIIN